MLCQWKLLSKSQKINYQTYQSDFHSDPFEIVYNLFRSDEKDDFTYMDLYRMYKYFKLFDDLDMQDGKRAYLIFPK